MRFLPHVDQCGHGCGLLGATYLAVLVLQLNPQVPIVSTTACDGLPRSSRFTASI
jgi:hypothetical protein